MLLIVLEEGHLVCECAQIVYKLADLGFAKDQSKAADCHTRLGTLFYIVSCLCFTFSLL